MIVWIQYCVDGTGGVKSKWAVMLLEITLGGIHKVRMQ